MNETIELDADGVAAVEFLEKLLKASGEPLPTGLRSIAKVSDHPMSPILPTSAPNPSNHPIHDSASDADRLERELAEMTSASIQARPLGPFESREQRVRWQAINDTAFRAKYGELQAALALIRAGKSVTKAEADRQAQAEKVIHEAGDEFARLKGISVEKARTIIRRAYRNLAKAELGQ
jgi:hypothetical protein